MLRISRVLLVWCLVLLGQSCSDSANRKSDVVQAGDGFYTDQSAYKQFSARTRDTIEQFFPPDFSGTVLIYRNGRLFRRAFGYRDMARKERMQENDMFQLASASKPLTAVCVMQLASKGLLHTDSPVTTYLRDFPYAGVTVRHLLNHRSGLANYVYFTDTFWKDPLKPMDNRALYDFLKNCKPKPYLPPDLSFSYCNTNFAVLVNLIETISGKQFHAYAEENILKPAGMRQTYFHGHRPARIKGTAVTGRYEHYLYADPYYLDAVLGDKSMISTVGDMFLFNRALASGRLLDTSRLAAMQQPSYRHNVYGGSYGLGFRLMELPGGQWTYHNGWWRGFWTSFWNRFDKDICFVILCNNKRSSHVDKKGLAVWLATGRL